MTTGRFRRGFAIPVRRQIFLFGLVLSREAAQPDLHLKQPPWPPCAEGTRVGVVVGGSQEATAILHPPARQVWRIHLTCWQIRCGREKTDISQGCGWAPGGGAVPPPACGRGEPWQAFRQGALGSHWGLGSQPGGIDAESSREPEAWPGRRGGRAGGSPCRGCSRQGRGLFPPHVWPPAPHQGSCTVTSSSWLPASSFRGGRMCLSPVGTTFPGKAAFPRLGIWVSTPTRPALSSQPAGAEPASGRSEGCPAQPCWRGL